MTKYTDIKKAIIWSKEHCVFCDRAKNKLSQLHISFEERKIGEKWTLEDLHQNVPHARTLPQIWIDGHYIKEGSAGDLVHIGGYDQLEKRLK